MERLSEYILEYVSSGKSRNKKLEPSEVVTVDDLISFLDSLKYVRKDNIHSAEDMLEEKGNIYSYIRRRMDDSPSIVLVRVEAMKCVYALCTYSGSDEYLLDCYWYKGRRNGYKNSSTTVQYALKMIHDYARH